MKLAQLFENQSIFGTMLLKLVKAGEPVFLNAKARTFLTGNDSKGYQAMRSNKQGWVIQFDYRGAPKSDDPVEYVSYELSNSVLHISSYKEFAMAGKGSHHSMLFEFEKPIDDHYTIKKIDGVWTIIDREQVTEQMDDEEFMLKMAQRLAKKHGHEGKMSENDALEFEYAGFKVLMFYLPEKNANRPWAVGWYKNGKIANQGGKLDHFEDMRMALADIFGHDMVKESQDDIDFHLRMMARRLKKEFNLDEEHDDISFTDEHVKIHTEYNQIYVAIPSEEGEEGSKWDVWMNAKNFKNLTTPQVIATIRKNWLKS